MRYEVRAIMNKSFGPTEIPEGWEPFEVTLSNRSPQVYDIWIRRVVEDTIKPPRDPYVDLKKSKWKMVYE